MVEGGTDGLDGSSIIVIPNKTPAYSSYLGQGERDLTLCGVEQGYLSEMHHPSIKAIEKWKLYFEIIPQNISLAKSAKESLYEQLLSSELSSESKRNFCIRMFNEIFGTDIEKVLEKNPPNKMDEETGSTIHTRYFSDVVSAFLEWKEKVTFCNKV